MTATRVKNLERSQEQPEAGERLRIFDEEFVVRVTGDETGGRYAVATGSVAPGGGPPLHAHPGPETVYVLTGEFEFTRRDAHGVSTTRGGPGAVFHAPGGTPHRFENVSPTRSALLTVIPADAVDMLREFAAAFPPGSEPDMEKMLSIQARYGDEIFYGEAGSRPEPPRAGATSGRARALAWRFARANEELIATIEGCSLEQWRATCADTGWTVGVQAHHVADGESHIAGGVQAIADGHPHPPLPSATLDAINARHAAEFANVTLEETIDLLRRNGLQAAVTYRMLTDEQLARTAKLLEGGQPASVADLIEHLAIGEIERHGAYIRSAIGG